MMVSWMSDLADGRRIYSVHLVSILQALAGKYVKSGCNATIDSGMNLSVNFGVVVYDGNEYNVSSKSITIDANNTSISRVDVIVWDYNGGYPTVKVLKGTDSFNINGEVYPIAPMISDEQIPLALVIVRSGATQLSSSDLYDLRTTQILGEKPKYSIGEINIDADIIPDVDIQRSLGGENLRWLDLWVKNISGNWLSVQSDGASDIDGYLLELGRLNSSPTYSVYIGAIGGSKENELVVAANGDSGWKDLIGFNYNNNEINVYATSLNVDGSILENGVALDAKYASISHTHKWEDIDKTGSKLSDIGDVQSYTNNANKFLKVNETEDGVEWVTIATTDEYVKADSGDATPGYLSNKVDGVTIDVDTTNHVLKVKDGVFASIDLSNVADSTILAKLKNVDGFGSGLDADMLDGNHASDFALVGHTHALGNLSDVNIVSLVNSQVLKYDGTTWTNSNIDWSEIENKPATYPPSAHTHDVADLILDNSLIPNADNSYDLGSSSSRWKDGYFAGTITADKVIGNTLREGNMLVSNKYLEATWKIVTDSITNEAVVLKRGSGEVYRGNVDGAFAYITSNCSDGDVIEVYGDYTITQSIVFTDKSYIIFKVYGTITNNVTGDYAIKFVKNTGQNKFNEIMIKRIYGNGNNGILIKDGFHNKIYDTSITNVVKGITIAVELEWSESNMIENIEFNNVTEYNIGFELFGSATSGSFVNTVVRHVSMNVQKYGIYIGNGCNVRISWFENVHGWATADGATFFRCEGNIWKTMFVVPYFEDVNSLYTGEVMFYVPGGGSYVVFEYHAINIDTVFGDDGTTDNKPFVTINDNFIEFGNKAPSPYGGITNAYNDWFVGWRLLSGDKKKVVNLFETPRSDEILWIWQNKVDWSAIAKLYYDGRFWVSKGFMGGVIGNNSGSAILKFINDVDDNSLYLELFSSDETGTGNALWITGKYNQEAIPSVNINATNIWISGSLNVGGGYNVNGESLALRHLVDVNNTLSPSSGNVLKYDGTTWTNSYVDWSEVENKPTAYPPSAHTHTIADITDIGNASVSYASSAGDADTIDGKHASDFMLVSTYDVDGDGVVEKADVVTTIDGATGGVISGDVTISGAINANGGTITNPVLMGGSPSAKIKIMSDGTNSDRVYFEVFTEDESASGGLWITGRYSSNLNWLELRSNLTNIYGRVQPTTDNAYDLGTSTLRWANVYAVNVYQGDAIFENGWRITEKDDDGNLFNGLRILDDNGNEIFKIVDDGLWFKGQKIV